MATPSVSDDKSNMLITTVCTTTAIPYPVPWSDSEFEMKPVLKGHLVTLAPTEDSVLGNTGCNHIPTELKSVLPSQYETRHSMFIEISCDELGMVEEQAVLSAFFPPTVVYEINSTDKEEVELQCRITILSLL